MATSTTDNKASRPLPHHVAVIGAAGVLARVFSVCRGEGFGFTAIVRSSPERMTEVPASSRIAVLTFLADRVALTVGFSGAKIGGKQI